MTAKEDLYSSILSILNKGWEGNALKENRAILESFINKITEEQAQDLINDAESRFTSGTVSGVMRDPKSALAWGLSLMFATITADHSEKTNGQPYSASEIDAVTDTLLTTMPGQKSAVEWRWVELFERWTQMKAAEKTIKSTPPQNALVIVDKLTHALPTAVINEGKGVTFDVGTGSGKKKEDLILFLLETSEDSVIKYGGKITPFDISVNDAVCGLLYAGNTSFTIKQLIRHMKSKGASYQPSKPYCNKVKRSIDKQLAMRLSVDVGKLVEYKKDTQKNYLSVLNERGIDIKRTYIEDNMLSLTTLRTVINGAKVEAYAAKYDANGIEMPIRYRVALFTGAIKKIPVLAFDVPKLKNTDRNDVLLRHLVRELWRIGNNNGSNKMRYDSLYKACAPTDEADPAEAEEKDRDAAERVERSRFRSDVKRILDYWKQEDFFEGFKSFKEYKKGREIVGVEIVFKHK